MNYSLRYSVDHFFDIISHIINIYYCFRKRLFLSNFLQYDMFYKSISMNTRSIFFSRTHSLFFLQNLFHFSYYFYSVH